MPNPEPLPAKPVPQSCPPAAGGCLPPRSWLECECQPARTRGMGARGPGPDPKRPPLPGSSSMNGNPGNAAEEERGRSTRAELTDGEVRTRVHLEREEQTNVSWGLDPGRAAAALPGQRIPVRLRDGKAPGLQKEVSKHQLLPSCEHRTPVPTDHGLDLRQGWAALHPTPPYRASSEMEGTLLALPQTALLSSCSLSHPSLRA